MSDDYVQIPFMDEIQLLDPSPSGTGEWVKIQTPKWDYNWVEFYIPFAEPFQFEFGYTLPLEFGNDIFNMDFSLATKKWYIPASGQPYFNMSLEVESVQEWGQLQCSLSRYLRNQSKFSHFFLKLCHVSSVSVI